MRTAYTPRNSTWHHACIVPTWFTDVLHAIIYAGADDAHRTIQALAAALTFSPQDMATLPKMALGLTQGRIADELGVSRHCICRQLKRLRRALGESLLCVMNAPHCATALLAAFVERGGHDDTNVKTVIERLQPLSRNELGVLFGLIRRQSKGEVLNALGIGHTHYHQIKAKLTAAFIL